MLMILTVNMTSEEPCYKFEPIIKSSNKATLEYYLQRIQECVNANTHDNDTDLN